ncbi:gamma-glutamyl-gamma-aminobutyrate hydrolase family protein [uncultured Actinomyces sp.]|uniref:gamma-glutamyl-gamma-aminobutyrate hydrolase family protein n=1 Tax=uncultured Actinomyces sp. TaxID=249061 RepID=UPI0028EDBB0B|nr:gamma-glutamyl-gamma-aminobutyrate hydrolase family protein [uncultured Actinomyces sp.]
MTNHTKPTLLISNVLPARPGDEAYNNICMRLWDRLLEAALPTWNVIREYAQEDGAEGATLRASAADAIIIMGGEDVHPAHYGASQGYKREGRHWYRADLGQLALVDYAARTGTPLLGICRGMQIINTAFGGTLEQDIADGTHSNPTILSDHRFVRHSVRVDADSHLERALAPVLTDSELIISSAHHQRVARLAQGFQVSAQAPDGTVEAIESPDAPIIGVQWHPEDPADDIAQLRCLLGHLDARRVPRLEKASTTLVA